MTIYLYLHILNKLYIYLTYYIMCIIIYTVIIAIAYNVGGMACLNVMIFFLRMEIF